MKIYRLVRRLFLRPKTLSAERAVWSAFIKNNLRANVVRPVCATGLITFDFLYEKPAQKLGYIGLFTVDGKFRGRGVGQAALEEIYNAMPAGGVLEVRSVSYANPVMIALLTKLSFRPKAANFRSAKGSTTFWKAKP